MQESYKQLVASENKLRIKEKALQEADRYFENAKTMLTEKAAKMGEYYTDVKYVKTAYGILYNGVLLMLDAYIEIKGEQNQLKERKSIDYYRANIVGRDNKLLNYVNSAYNILHLNGYYDGELCYGAMKLGMTTYNNIKSYIATRC